MLLTDWSVSQLRGRQRTAPAQSALSCAAQRARRARPKPSCKKRFWHRFETALVTELATLYKTRASLPPSARAEEDQSQLANEVLGDLAFQLRLFGRQIQKVSRGIHHRGDHQTAGHLQGCGR